MTDAGSAAARGVPDDMSRRLIVALDLDTADQAMALVQILDGVASFFKVGMGLFVAPGAERLIDGLVRAGKDVFLDYKMFDIPETVRKGVAQARERGVRFVTVHGDRDIMEAAVLGKHGSESLKIFAITALTSLDDARLAEMGYRLTVPELIALRVRDAMRCGCDGVIASAHDDPARIRALYDADRLLITTPGVRPATAGVDDHKRVATPAAAIRAGADYLVVGRPIWATADPRLAARAIIAEMEAGRTPG